MTVETLTETSSRGSPMCLKSRLAALRSRAESDLPHGAFDRLQAEAAQLRASGTLRQALKAGDTAPDFRLRDGQGAMVRLGALLQAGPVVICFYRGDWCQFCTLELEAWTRVSGEVTALGASLVGIAPQASNLRHQCGTASTPFPLLADLDAKVAKSFGVAFMPADELHGEYRALGRPCGADYHTPLPVPATYVVDPSGQIVFSYLDSDFTNRIEPAEILIALRRLQSMRPAAAVSNPPPFRRRT
ncbi:peroxiredoxin-like family protein [Acidisphaera sp. L21]|uniref:peroxiredoxin-like family protein n=1 Tax=Acidisphaera sp. L21 TaxID=1641851 RepID=UPI00131D0F31|nr:peroxiredoxin-like family protein [Acidisphaera sp. L21]